MDTIRALIEARRYGEVRCGVVSDLSGDLARVLGKFGLVPDAGLLVRHSRPDALEILIELLWKDMAYEGECMPRSQAEQIASAFMEVHAEPNAEFYSNGNWAKRESWNPLTESTFDAGLLVACGGGSYSCIWFQDED